MPPLPASSSSNRTTTSPPSQPRVVVYFQTYHSPNDQSPISLLPLLTHHPTGLTHLILSALHLNSSSPYLTLNNDPPDHPKYTTLWDEVLVLRDSLATANDGHGVKIMAMLGGAARGSYPLLADLSSPGSGVFNPHYAALLAFLRRYSIDGIDLDVEEPTPLATIVNLIDNLSVDMGPEFIITLSPVATALMPEHFGLRHLSGFSYFELERLRGARARSERSSEAHPKTGMVAWYNAQFYNGWTPGPIPAPTTLAEPTQSTSPIGNSTDTHTPMGNYSDSQPPSQSHRQQQQQQLSLAQNMLRAYSTIVDSPASPFTSDRVVLGLLTNPHHGGSGFLRMEALAGVLGMCVEKYGYGYDYGAAGGMGGVGALTGGAGGAGDSGRRGFGGVMGWELWCPDSSRRRPAPSDGEQGQGEGEDEDEGWKWITSVSLCMGMKKVRDSGVVVKAGRDLASSFASSMQSG